MPDLHTWGQAGLQVICMQWLAGSQKISRGILEELSREARDWVSVKMSSLIYTWMVKRCSFREGEGQQAFPGQDGVPRWGWALGKWDGVESDSQINRKGFPSEEPSSRGSPETWGNLGMGIMPSQSTPDTFSYPPLPSFIHQADVGLPNTAKWRGMESRP